MRTGLAATALGAVLGVILVAAPGAASASELMELSLEELGSFEITSVTKKAEALQGSAAAVYVITREDMRRSGYTSIAEALRMVPGVQVARNNSHDWDIGARGFNTGLSNKLLVMIDGRSVYSPFFSGVFWELRDVPVEDIDRIEVIRGPGAALWGSNAVNGVINIITRSASETKGVTLRGGGGTEERVHGLVRYGGEAGDDADYRISASGHQRHDGDREGSPDDSWYLGRLQGRGDWSPTDRDQLMFSAEFFQGELDQNRPNFSIAQPFTPAEPEEADRLGANLLARWDRALGADSSFSTQFWYEYTDIEFTVLRELRHTGELEIQHSFPLGERNDLIWGAAYRLSYDDARTRGTTTLDPEHRAIHLVTGFVQDQIALWPERVQLTLGSKFEYNEFTKFEVQPSARLAYTPNEKHTLWGAVSRAVRTPTRLDEDSDLGLLVIPPLPPGISPFSDPVVPTLLVLRGNRRFTAEDVLAWEAGYRVRPHRNLNFDVAGFYNDYDNLATAELGSPEPVAASGSVPAHRILPFVLDNELSGYSYGVEVAGWWQVKPWWRLHASYSFLEIHLDLDSDSRDLGGSEDIEGQAPEHQALVRSSFDLPHGIEVDGILRWVNRLQRADVDSYVELDLRLGWEFCDDWEFAVVGQNLLQEKHAESAPPATRVERGVYGSLSYRWGAER